jgi:hypothetical protein
VVLQRVDADLTEVEVDGEVAIYHPGTDKVVLLNAAASEIWRRLPVSSTEDLAGHLAEVFGIDLAEARAGVEAGVALLADEQLLAEQPEQPEESGDGPQG